MRCLVLLFLGATVVAEGIDLAALVDRPTPAARKQAALELARRSDVSLDALLAAMREFAPKSGDVERGARTEEVQRTSKGDPDEIEVLVPRSYDPKKAAPLVLALHGAGGHGGIELERWRDVAEELGALVVAPTDGGENVGYAHSQRERSQALDALRWARRRFNVDENRIHLTGVSRGGHMTWDIATRHPDRFASLAPMIGGPRLALIKGQNNLRYLANVAHLPIRDLQGEGDHPLLLFNLRYAFKRLEAFGARDARLITFPTLGHGFDFESVKWKEFLGGARRDPRPMRVVRCSANARERRAYWVEIVKIAGEVKEVFTIRAAAGELRAMDDYAKRRFVAAEAEKRTARLEVEMVRPGVFRAKSTGVRSFRLLLTAEMFDPRQPVELTWNGRERKRKLKPSKRVLAVDFAERFDRTFLPIAEFKVP